MRSSANERGGRGSGGAVAGELYPTTAEEGGIGDEDRWKRTLGWRRLDAGLATA
jgi:hypothetical protein